jgi:hypothetical protein
MMKPRKRRNLPKRKPERKKFGYMSVYYPTPFKEDAGCCCCLNAIGGFHPPAAWELFMWVERRHWYYPVRGELDEISSAELSKQGLGVA